MRRPGSVDLGSRPYLLILSPINTSKLCSPLNGYALALRPRAARMRRKKCQLNARRVGCQHMQKPSLTPAHQHRAHLLRLPFR